MINWHRWWSSSPLSRYQRKRKQWAERVAASRSEQARQAYPWPESVNAMLCEPSIDSHTPCHALDYLVFDIECSGLDAEKDTILSIGWLSIEQQSIKLNSAQHYYITPDAPSAMDKDAVAIHQIMPKHLQQGIAIETAFQRLFDAAQGKVLVVHGKCVEVAFMAQFFARYYQTPLPPFYWLDTLTMEKNSLQAKGDFQQGVTLSEVRQRHGLPPYPEHHALSDALATAELWLAQMHRRDRQSPVTFGEVFAVSEKPPRREALF
ncbi:MULTISPECIES: exonuclease domain-containing protein [unclassified Vibrio]|uniref:Exonuclease domain-containing protein n=1 Tax=Vibrio sp. HB236076 TaxID=3232307 RepID=A0AB39HDU3_9VIBR|nr:exonuclease domain-containing protein [Vibrio sp. HB161653]MDP5255359.1 exonuclease domain-containing protein [Vibrio sp. HB161653]